MFIGVLSCLFNFVHYGLLTPKQDGETFFVVMFSQSLIFLGISNYYLNLSIDFMDEKKNIAQILIKIVTAISLISILSIGIYLTVKLNTKFEKDALKNDDDIWKFARLCKYDSFIGFKIIPMIYSVIFTVVFLIIRHKVLVQPRLTSIMRE